MDNDLPSGTALAGLEFQSGVTLTGNSLTVTGGVTVDQGVAATTIAADIVLAGQVKLDVAGGTLIDSGSLSGTGGLVKYGEGTMAIKAPPTTAARPRSVRASS